MPAAVASEAALGRWGLSLVSIGMIVSMLATLNGTVMSGGRIPFAVARDGYLFKALGEVHPKFHTPGLALVIQAAVAIVLIVLGGAFRELFSLDDFRGMAFLCRGGEHHICLSEARAAGNAAVPDRGLSGRAGIVHRDGGGVALLHIPRQLAGLHRWGGRNFVGDPGVSVVCETPGRA